MGFENIEQNELENCFLGNEISGSSFVKKLHIMVSSCDNSIISWCKGFKHTMTINNYSIKKLKLR